jgi:hypothetical protein
MSIINTVTPFSNNETVKTALSSEYIRSKTAIGSTPSTISTISCIEYSTGASITAVLTLTNFVVGALNSAAAALGVGNIIYSFPSGDQHLETAYSFWNLALTCPGTAVTCKVGLGSVIASGAVSVLSGTATFQDRVTAQDITTAASGGTAVNAGPVGATAGIQTGIALNGTSAVKNVFLNAAGTFNANNTNNLLANGQIFIQWNRFSS